MIKHCPACRRKILWIRETDSSALLQIDLEPHPEGEWEILGTVGAPDVTARRPGFLDERKGKPDTAVVIRSRVPVYTLRSIGRTFRDDGGPGKVEPNEFTEEQWNEIRDHEYLRVESVSAPPPRPGVSGHRDHRESCPTRKCVALACPHGAGGYLGPQCRQRPSGTAEL